MSEIEEKLIAFLNPIIQEKGLYLDELHYAKKGKDNYLTIYVEKEDDSVDLDQIVELSDALSKRLDELDLIKEYYMLDVSTSGAEKPIKDLNKLSKYIDKYIQIQLSEPIDNLFEIKGYLKEVNEDFVKMSYKVKTREKLVEILISNIKKANLAIKF